LYNVSDETAESSCSEYNCFFHNKPVGSTIITFYYYYEDIGYTPFVSVSKKVQAFHIEYGGFSIVGWLHMILGSIFGFIVLVAMVWVCCRSSSSSSSASPSSITMTSISSYSDNRSEPKPKTEEEKEAERKAEEMMEARRIEEEKKEAKRKEKEERRRNSEKYMKCNTSYCGRIYSKREVYKFNGSYHCPHCDGLLYEYDGNPYDDNDCVIM